MANRHKFDDAFMIMMCKLVMGIEIGKAWLKDKKDLMKISQAKARTNFWDAYESYLHGVLAMSHAHDGIGKKITL